MVRKPGSTDLNLLRFLRPEMREFAKAMERKLRERDVEYGDSWKKMDPARLQDLLKTEFYEWWDAQNTTNEESELVDLANVAMFVWARGKGRSD